MSLIPEERDAFGRALLDHLEGRPGPPLVLEADDGSSRPADMQPPDFFAGPDAWPEWERAAVDRSEGAILDLGAGAGRHALHLQGRGHPVTAVDASPGAVAVCRARGVADVRLGDLRALEIEGRWDTVLLMGGNLGLAGDLEPTRELLRGLTLLTSDRAVLIGDSVDPTSDDPEDLAYEVRNRETGFHPGHVRLRLRYGEMASPWWDLLNVRPAELEELVEGTGWALVDLAGDDEGYAVMLRRSAADWSSRSRRS